MLGSKPGSFVEDLLEETLEGSSRLSPGGAAQALLDALHCVVEAAWVAEGLEELGQLVVEPLGGINMRLA